jgi:hypothetical protein
MQELAGHIYHKGRRLARWALVTVAVAGLHLLATTGALGQSGNLDTLPDGTVRINGNILPYMIDDCGDTIILAQLEGVSITSLQTFQTQEDKSRYRRYRQYALKVYPYAVEAIRIFREVEYATGDMKKRKRRRYVKELQRELKEEFNEPLKDLSKTQGLILFKMIERELDRPMYELIRELRNGLAATYWNTMASMYGHRLKEGYIPGEDPILDAVLNDLNISYERPENRYAGENESPPR